MRRPKQALELHLQLGSLAGRRKRSSPTGIVASAARPRPPERAKPPRSRPASCTSAAFQHFRVSSVLGRLPPRAVSRRRTGAGRGPGLRPGGPTSPSNWSNYPIAQGHFGEALVYAEEAKARGLQEMLAGHDRTDRKAANSRGVEQILAEWPRGVVALEYFLGAENAWVFVVDAPGSVHAYPLKSAAGGALSSSELIALVQQFLQQTTFTANKMLQLQRAGSGFDPRWQQQLYDFHQILLPPPARAAIAKAELVEIVPQHILHYFPFAALVTRLDPEKRGPLEHLALPTFLIEASPPLCYAPSLATWDLLRLHSSSRWTKPRLSALSSSLAPRRCPALRTISPTSKRSSGRKCKVSWPATTPVRPTCEVARQAGLVVCRDARNQRGRRPALQLLVVPCGQ